MKKTCSERWLNRLDVAASDKRSLSDSTSPKIARRSSDGRYDIVEMDELMKPTWSHEATTTL